MKILISGGTGFIGSNLIKSSYFSDCDFIVKTRSLNKIKSGNSKIKYIDDINQIDSNEKIDVIINLAGENIAAKRWTIKQKEKLLQSRIAATEEIINIIAKLEQKPKVLISASAIGFYGSFQDEEVTESTAAKDEFTHHLCASWEFVAQKAYEKFKVRTCITRFGVVLGNGGALAKMLPAFKMGLGGPIASGLQYFSWVHIEDVIGSIKFLIDNESCAGPYNICSKKPLRNYNMSKIIGKVLHRPTFLRMPKIIVKLLFGKMGEDLLVNGQKVLPQRITDAGFKFIYNDFEDALKDIL